MNKQELSDLIFGESGLSLDDLYKKYPKRELVDGAKVTRVGPSPTGFMHIGGIYASLISERTAHKSNGIYFLRIEDTDKVREIEGAVDVIINSLKQFNIIPDEGEVESGIEIGNYGPYRQSQRKEIYKAVVRYLFEKDLAYPCFCSSEDLEKITKEQEIQKIRPGYRGEWAICRNKNNEEVERLIKEGKPFAIRFKSDGNFENKIKFKDQVKGDVELSENDLDFVLVKSDGLPTYHFAHVVDDYLMGTTDVIRGDEWLSSLPLHLQLWRVLEWKTPRYAHISPIEKIDEGSRRKLSKRKDLEANVIYYIQKGYPPQGVIEYLLNLANSSFEDWRKANPKNDYKEFNFDPKKLSKSGALLDEVKLNDVCKDIISQMTAKEIFDRSLSWAKEYEPELAQLFEKDPSYILKIFSIERSEKGGRKDIAKWLDIKEEISFFFDESFKLTTEEIWQNLDGTDEQIAKQAVEMFLSNYNEKDSAEEWFSKIKIIAEKLSYAQSAKEFKADPGKYKGYVGDIAKIFRVLITGKIASPDLYQIMQVLGEDRVKSRLNKIKTSF